MNSLPTSTSKPDPQPLPELAANAGATWLWSPQADCGSIDAWMDLMEAVEALCPHWPARPLVIGQDYRM